MKTLRNPAQKSELLLRLRKIQPSSPRCWGSMSAHQMICHLSDDFRLYMGEITAAPVSLPVPKWLLRTATLWMPIHWPRGVKTMPELDQQAGCGTPPRDFAADVSELQNLLDRFTQLPENFSWKPHPHFGPLSYSEWMRLAYLHADHHLRQFGA